MKRMKLDKSAVSADDEKKTRLQTASQCPTGCIEVETDIDPGLEVITLDELTIECEKNKSHKSFIPIDKFSRLDLLSRYQDEVTEQAVKVLADLTVQVTAAWVSEDRPEKYPSGEAEYPYVKERGGTMLRKGSGYVQKVVTYGKGSGMKDPCECRECRYSSSARDVWWEVEVVSARHIIYDHTEARGANIDLFYDGSTGIGRKERKKMKGYNSMWGSSVDGDRCVLFCPTHDEQLAHTLKDLCKTADRLVREANSRHQHQVGPHMAVVVSHPHGCQKYITVGESTTTDKLDEEGRQTYTYTADTCRGSSGGLVWVVGRWELTSYVTAPHSRVLDKRNNKSGDRWLARLIWTNNRFKYT
ncbi:uncharacterized protein LOC101859450 [Aplysia californica]|uniref:Uncharacterized protein LOC101859450 n=1 Tax=Aplysia californica TaxID=6500 RepID=A0ABM1W330_APLCA|nr:uncharacterized protein LOC101859450 [Aplysia californica]XP_012945249.1 uncharacterized protein LOC101859450 [Aplysia californica]XP_035829073.1 uncharacterized protein LOC101859450 [Aplysia californica]